MFHSDTQEVGTPIVKVGDSNICTVNVSLDQKILTSVPVVCYLIINIRPEESKYSHCY